MFKEINTFLKWDKGSGDLRVRFYPAKFPSSEKKFKKSLELDVVAHTFNPSTRRS